ncbi:hypothetical protein [Verticiella sediminum]|uniref:hypothetical protein n=1 Tax=Verticiella sediminum TaxID=1247510 RepID=UPI0014785B6B|nr:hypothetical protein [Verticiella sediminum]
MTLFVRPKPVTPLDHLDLASSQYCDLHGRPATYLGNDTFQLFDGTLAKRSNSAAD